MHFEEMDRSFPVDYIDEIYDVMMDDFGRATAYHADYNNHSTARHTNPQRSTGVGVPSKSPPEAGVRDCVGREPRKQR